ncbi:MAG: DUF4234 domain-containing protein [Desulfurococcales archaeon]|nr:DUF4234 domain-containing protein [Desulfurococcales archaeon]
MSMVERLRQDIRMRNDTDYIMPVWLPFVSIILLIVGAVFFIAALALSDINSISSLQGNTNTITITRNIGISGLNLEASFGASVLGAGLALMVLGGLIQLYVIYKWIDRMNKHFKRTILLYKDLAEYFEEKGLNNRAESMRTIIRQMEVEQTEHGPFLWIILVLIINILVYYVYHFLSKDFYVHNRRELYLWEEASKAMEELGHPLMFRSMYSIPDRNTVLYFVLSLITMGVFQLYWVYTLTLDPNNHFKEHTRFEDELIDKIEKIEENLA